MGKNVTTFPHSGNAFLFIIQKHTKFKGLYFLHFTIFCNQPDNHDSLTDTDNIAAYSHYNVFPSTGAKDFILELNL